MENLHLYNTYSKRLEKFESINPNHVGIYICGPTVYGSPHLGHVRGPITFDVLRRYLLHLGYKVRFVRNVTDVGHLVGDGDEGEDKLAKQARIEQIEPMEIAQFYTEEYNSIMRSMNIIPPSIEPRASGHIIEQIEMIAELIEKGLAYQKNGSVYFDVLKYAESNEYGKLSGRKLEDLIAGAGNEARELENQEEKKNPNDFALWKNAAPEHIMKWNSPWGMGFPGWHIECSAMSKKYLGHQFDIHGGGMDLLFPHHESEIAQSTGSCGVNPAKYWMHHNMVTINGQKMAKSLNNGIKVTELFSGNHSLLDKEYSAMSLRFAILQAHYRSTMDFSNAALSSAEKGFQRICNAFETLKNIQPQIENTSELNAEEIDKEIRELLNTDLATPQVLAVFFDLATTINNIADKRITINKENKEGLIALFDKYFFGVLGFIQEKETDHEALNSAMQILLELRKTAKIEKNYALSDQIRNQLNDAGFLINDGKDGSTWSKN